MPVDYFVNDIDPNSEMQTSSVFEETKQIFILNEEIFDAWINVIFLGPFILYLSIIYALKFIYF